MSAVAEWRRWLRAEQSAGNVRSAEEIELARENQRLRDNLDLAHAYLQRALAEDGAICWVCNTSPHVPMCALAHFIENGDGR